LESETSLWHGVVATLAPRVAAADSPRRQPTSAQRAVLLNRFEGVLRAGRRETASSQRAEQGRFRRREHPAIHSHRQSQNEL